MESDPLLVHHQSLIEKTQAWQQAWNDRGQAQTASVAELMSRSYLGSTVAQQIEKRLLEGRLEIDHQIARFAGMLAAAIALLFRAGDTETIERQTQEAFLRIGKSEDGFATKMAELRPLVELYRRLNTALSSKST